MIAINQMILTALLGVGVFGLLMWAIKNYLDLKSKTPRAACGFVTAADLEEHCKRMQAPCTALMALKLGAIEASINLRLHNGDQLLADHSRRLGDLEKSISGSIGRLDEIVRGMKDHKNPDGGG
jgi:hypothetical protein